MRFERLQRGMGLEWFEAGAAQHRHHQRRIRAAPAQAAE